MRSRDVSIVCPRLKATARRPCWCFAPPVCANQPKELTANTVYFAVITTNSSVSRMVKLYEGNIRRRTGGENSSSRVVWTVEGSQLHTRPVRKVSGHFEYLENRLRGLDVTWQPVRGDLTAHSWTVTVPWGWSVDSETPLTELVYCVTVAFTNLTFNCDFGFGKNQKSQGTKSGL